MNRTKILMIAGALVTTFAVHAQVPDKEPAAVDVTNFARAESHMYFRSVVRQAGLGKFRHHRELMPIERQTVVRPNRDTVYSSAIFDLDAGPVTIALPDAGQRYISAFAVNEDHFARPAVYKPGNYTFDKETVGTRYVLIGVRILLDPKTPGDVGKVHALQDAIQVRQAKTGSFDIPEWNPVSQKKIRDALRLLGSTVPDSRGMFGTRGQVDPVRHLIGASAAWGGAQEKDAMYLMVTPSRNDGATVHRLSVRDVPVDAFWSISVYNADGYFEKNSLGAYTINNLSARKATDGSATIQFGGCDGMVANCLPVMPGWNYMVRLYLPRPELLDGKWTFPEVLPLP